MSSGCLTRRFLCFFKCLNYVQHFYCVFKSEADDVFTEKVNKIMLSFNDYKLLQSFNGAKSYLYGVSVGRVCKGLLHAKIKK